MSPWTQAGPYPLHALHDVHTLPPMGAGPHPKGPHPGLWTLAVDIMQVYYLASTAHLGSTLLFVSTSGGIQGMYSWQPILPWMKWSER